MRIRRIILVILLLAVASLAVYWFLIRKPSTPAASALSGSGTVEATMVTVSPEMAGRVAEVFVNEGDQVKAGDTLFTLDSTLMDSQLNQAQVNLNAAQAGLDVAHEAYTAAQAGVDIAQAQYNLALTQALQMAQPGRSSAWQQPQPNQFDQPAWYYTHAEQLSAAQDELNASKEALDSEQKSFNDLKATATYTKLADTENRLAQARAAWADAQDVLNRAKEQGQRELTDAAQSAFDNASTELDDAQKAYDDLLTSQEASDVLDARASLAVAQERYDTAQDRYNALQTGGDSPQVQVANATLAQAQANVTLANSRIAQSKAVVDQAQAAMDLIKTQMEKLTITAPVAGAVLSRNIQPGEVIQPGASALALGDLANLRLTVYIPEDRYGEVKLGETAQVKVDSYPDQTFTGTVTHIADQAEFTPRNVQTAEGRSSTVYAVRLAVQDPQGQLKPGMPADVTFDQP